MTIRDPKIVFGVGFDPNLSHYARKRIRVTLIRHHLKLESLVSQRCS